MSFHVFHLTVSEWTFWQFISTAEVSWLWTSNLRFTHRYSVGIEPISSAWHATLQPLAYPVFPFVIPFCRITTKKSICDPIHKNMNKTVKSAPNNKLPVIRFPYLCILTNDVPLRQVAMRQAVNRHSQITEIVLWEADSWRKCDMTILIHYSQTYRFNCFCLIPPILLTVTGMYRVSAISVPFDISVVDLIDDCYPESNETHMKSDEWITFDADQTWGAIHHMFCFCPRVLTVDESVF